MKKQFAIAIAMLAFSTGAVAAESTAQTAAVPVAQQQKAPSNPATELQAGVDALVSFLRGNPSAVELAGYLEEQVAPKFDFDFMAQAAAGHLYPHMTDAQRERLTNKLQVIFLSAMAEKLSHYDNQDVAYLPPRRNRQGQVMVSVMVNNPGRYPGRIDFRMHQSNDGWKVYDVVGNGASAIAFYRTYFRRAMR